MHLQQRLTMILESTPHIHATALVDVGDGPAERPNRLALSALPKPRRKKKKTGRAAPAQRLDSRRILGANRVLLGAIHCSQACCTVRCAKSYQICHRPMSGGPNIPTTAPQERADRSDKIMGWDISFPTMSHSFMLGADLTLLGQSPVLAGAPRPSLSRLAMYYVCPWTMCTTPLGLGHCGFVRSRCNCHPPDASRAHKQTTVHPAALSCSPCATETFFGCHLLFPAFRAVHGPVVSPAVPHYSTCSSLACCVRMSFISLSLSMLGLPAETDCTATRHRLAFVSVFVPSLSSSIAQDSIPSINMALGGRASRMLLWWGISAVPFHVRTVVLCKFAYCEPPRSIICNKALVNDSAFSVVWHGYDLIRG
jgi:hypothetical protein